MVRNEGVWDGVKHTGMGFGGFDNSTNPEDPGRRLMIFDGGGGTASRLEPSRIHPPDRSNSKVYKSCSG